MGDSAHPLRRHFVEHWLNSGFNRYATDLTKDFGNPSTSYISWDTFPVPLQISRMHLSRSVCYSNSVTVHQPINRGKAVQGPPKITPASWHYILSACHDPFGYLMIATNISRSFEVHWMAWPISINKPLKVKGRVCNLQLILRSGDRYIHLPTCQSEIAPGSVSLSKLQKIQPSTNFETMGEKPGHEKPGHDFFWTS